jgi:hypothetical protein
MQRRIYRRHRLTRSERANHTHKQGTAFTLDCEQAYYGGAVVAEAQVRTDHPPCETRIRRTADDTFKVFYRPLTEPVS